MGELSSGSFESPSSAGSTTTGVASASSRASAESSAGGVDLGWSGVGGGVGVVSCWIGESFFLVGVTDTLLVLSSAGTCKQS